MICLENLDNSIILKCGHIYNVSCIENWINLKFNNREKITCPLCMQEVVTINLLSIYPIGLHS